MNDPAEALRAYIEEEYTLDDEGIAAADVEFTDADYNTEHAPQDPHIIVQLAGFRRLQPEENVLHEFTFIVSVSVFPQFRKVQADRAVLNALYWKIVNHLKTTVFDGFAKGDISGWEWAYVDTGANVGITLGTIPDEFVFNMSVKACIAWSA